MSTVSTSSSIVPSSIVGEESISGIQFRRATYDELQAQVNTQRETIQALELKIKRLQEDLSNAKLSLIKRKKVSASTLDVSAEVVLTKDLHRLGKYHATFYRIIVPKDFFGSPKPSISPFNAKQRYLDAESSRLANIAELYECIPNKYHSVISGDNMDLAISAFLKGISDHRSSVLNKLRGVAPTIFPTIPATVFLAGSSSRPSNLPFQHLSEHSEVQRLLAVSCIKNITTGEWKLVYSSPNLEVFPPLLYANADFENALGLFKSDELIRIGRTIIVGPSALKNEEAMRRSREDSPYAHMDNRPNRTTPGFIAWCATCAIYLLSDDTEFTSSGIGSRTGRQYLDNYDMYKRYLITQYGSLTSLFAFWDRALFPNLQVASLTSLTPQPTVILSTTTSIDPLQHVINNFNRQSTIDLEAPVQTEDENVGNKTDSDVEYFGPPDAVQISRVSQKARGAVDLESELNDSDKSDSDVGQVHNKEQPVTLSSYPTPSPAVSIPTVSTSFSNHSGPSNPSSSTAPIVTDAVHHVAQASIPRKAVRSGKKKTATLQQDATIVPSRPRGTRSSSRNIVPK